MQKKYVDNDTEPDFINNLGVKYWLNMEDTRAAISAGCKNFICWYIQEPKSKKNLVVTDNTTKEIIYTCPPGEDLLSYIKQIRSNY